MADSYHSAEVVHDGSGAAQPAHMQETQGHEKMLLDKTWERMQVNSFTAWCNSHLRKRDLKIEDLTKDFNDGILLINLLEIIGCEDLGRYDKKPRMKIMRINNIVQCLNYIAAKGVRLHMISAEEIHDGNLKLILGMLWTLILKWEINDIGEEGTNATDALLLWCQRKTKPYKNVAIEDFHRSWKDGIGFCALIHAHRPDLIADPSGLSAGQPEANLELAFSVAESQLDIPRFLKAEDMIMAIKPDERSIMTYIAQFYKAFATSASSNQAAGKISSVLEQVQGMDSLLADYNAKSTDLLDWLSSTTARFAARDPVSSVADVRAGMAGVAAIRHDEYPPRLREKGEVECDYHTLQTKLAIAGRPTFVPGRGRLIRDVDAAWAAMAAEQLNKQQWLVDELGRVQKVEHLSTKFDQKLAVHQRWNDGKEAMLSEEVPDRLGMIQAEKKKLSAWRSELEGKRASVDNLASLAGQLAALGAGSAASDSSAEATASLGRLRSLTDSREASLDEAERRAEQTDDLCLQFAQGAAPLNSRLDGVLDELHEYPMVGTEEEVVDLQARHKKVSDEALALEGDVAAVRGLSEQLGALGCATNGYTTLTMATLGSKWEEVGSLVESKRERLEQEAATQRSREELRVAFAAAAQTCDDWLNANSKKSDDIGGSSRGTLEEQLEAAQKWSAEIAEFAPQIKNVEEIGLKISEALIFDNPHTTLSAEEVSGKFSNMKSNAAMFANEIENQILFRDSKILSPEVLSDYRESFNFFDKDKSGALGRDELRACLVSLGYDIPSEPPAEGTPDPQMDAIMLECSPDGDGQVSFEEYISFMQHQNDEAETVEKLNEAFQKLAAGKPFVTEADIRSGLPAELCEYCLGKMPAYEGEGAEEGALDYVLFASALYGECDL